MAWTKAKTVIVVGAGLLLTAGTATVAVITVTHSEIDAYLKDPDLKTYLNAPPMIVLQKTHFPDYVSSPGGRQDGDKMIGRNLPLQFVISDAYATAMVRMVLPSDLPTQRYDYMDTITNRPREAFQALIRRKLGWTGRPELRDMDVLLLRIKMPEGPKLKVSPKNQLRNSAPGKFLDWPNQPVASLASFVEGCFQKPVVDQTGLTNFYDITIEGTWQPSAQANQDFLETALPKQLGLELVPTNMPIEILVVERAK